ncbi:uncharacterized protein N7482_000544 [Penicillium canariense]|uniref:Uncharacterized protein n=1 Tax=Penicillium canariense TaxID=189055 RepID=A0A9W9IDY9_9EURO|nr:uncharacterized protein N7482_000544 [Penicillium canariense]KAJ5174667.1 hypothetical protein N7482_000544 [Penicillium canariense]
MSSVSDQFFYLDAPTQSEEWLDFDQFLDLPSAYGDDYSASASASAHSVSPDMALPFESETAGMDLPDFTQSAFPDMINYDPVQEGFFADQSPPMGMIPDCVPALDDATFHGYDEQHNTSFDFRHLVEMQAAADPRITSIKEKRREAAIALHLQRLCDATALDLDMSSDSNTSFSSPAWSDYVRESISPQPASTSPETHSAPASAVGNGGVELVLDLNMNAAANLPKKQRPRSQAQKENYIKARKYGACEKHKKQHKRCNCLEKAAARAGVNKVPTNVSYQERPQRLALSSPLLPDSRVSSVPGYDRLLVSPTLRPSAKVSSAKVIKTFTKHAPEHDQSLSPTGVLPPVRAVTKCASSVRGHDPQYSASAFLAPVKEAGKNVVSQGQRILRQSPSVPQYVEATNQRAKAQPNLRWRVVGFSSTNSPATSMDTKESSNTRLSTSISSASSKPGVMRTPNVDLRRPRTTLSSHRLNVTVPSTTPISTQPQPSALAAIGRSSGSLGVPGVSNVLRIISDFKNPLAILTTRASPQPEAPLKDRRTESQLQVCTNPFGLSSIIVRTVATELGGLFSSALSAIAGVRHLSVSFSSWSEHVVGKCLSLVGSQLMSAKKGLQLFHSHAQTKWSV